MKKPPETITIDRAVFLDVAGSAYAAFILAQWNSTALIRRGVLSEEEAISGLKKLAELVRRSGKLGELAAPRIEQLIDQLSKAETKNVN